MTIDNAGIACEPRPACVDCGAAGEVLHAGLTDPWFGAPGEWSLRRCRACGLGWLDPQPLPDQLGRLYQHYWTHGAADAAVVSPPRPGALKRLAKETLAGILFWRAATFRNGLNHLQGMRPGRLLDVGCGDGRFLAQAADAGWRAVGVDFDAEAVAAAKRRPGVEAAVGSLADHGFEAGGFDAIMLDNVIEHLPDPAAAFAECARLLRPGGRLVMITPNLDALGHELYGPDWRGLEPPRHLYLFTAQALRRFARRAGFSAASICTSTGQTAPDWPMLATSAEARRQAGRPPVAVDLRTLKWRERLLDLAGLARGEWVVLVARR